MFGLGTWELLMIGGVILIVIGPTFLPRLGKALGKNLKELQHSTRSFSDNLREEMEAPVEDAPQLTDGSPELRKAAKDTGSA